MVWDLVQGVLDSSGSCCTPYKAHIKLATTSLRDSAAHRRLSHNSHPGPPNQTHTLLPCLSTPPAPAVCPLPHSQWRVVELRQGQHHVCKVVPDGLINARSHVVQHALELAPGRLGADVGHAVQQRTNVRGAQELGLAPQLVVEHL